MRVVVAGATGLVGFELVKQLAMRSGLEITALVRRIPQVDLTAVETRSPVNWRIFDFENPVEYAALAQENFDVTYCCLGTTRRKAGSAEAFRKVDLEFPQKLLEAVSKSHSIFCLVSSVGADNPVGLYLQTKAQIENAVRQSGLRFVIVRPSLLLGERNEFRFAELVAQKFSKPFKNLWVNNFGKKLARYAPIDAYQVAHAMINATLNQAPSPDGNVIEGRNFFEF
ncbi:NAD-dependent epimerase/dehydratase family protein [bacterium]|nr:NAD-dependent epimerase/dehydratase family protein [bacterium]